MIDICFLGTDHYDKASFVNKIGSKQIVELAAQVGCPVYVLGDSRKDVEVAQVKTDRLYEKVPFREHARLVNEQL